jgi:hypothetical protein
VWPLLLRLLPLDSTSAERQHLCSELEQQHRRLLAEAQVTTDYCGTSAHHTTLHCNIAYCPDIIVDKVLVAYPTGSFHSQQCARWQPCWQQWWRRPLRDRQSQR